MGLPLVTKKRVIEQLEREEISYSEENDITVAIYFSDVFMRIIVHETYVRIYGCWRGILSSPEDIEQGLYVVNEANNSSVAPKWILSRIKNDPTDRCISLEITHLTGRGMTDIQLKTHLLTSISIIFWEIKKLAEKFPHLVTWETGEEN
ncbi:hypothetical protein KRX54_02320 [Actinomycetaceae bacterium TAE3-ERU4]|nr:hypothetical protein [Actinomycetaceae bacterium TAE3-ERU4]